MKHTARTTPFCLFMMLIALLCAALNVSAETAPLKALIIDGQNNHNWRAITPELKKALEDPGRFTVSVATTPKDMSTFAPDFSAYDVIVSNYTGASWPKTTETAFEKYMAEGGGLVIVHAADNAFPKWKAFNEMIGLGGWGGRNEKSGPYVYVVDGKIVYDHSPGSGGSHGSQRPFLVKAFTPDHPIMKGLPAKWLHVKDELYCKLRGPAKNMTILATSFSRLTKREEPSLFTIRYGKGRIFHTVMGHDAAQCKCLGFAITLQRGTEWAATGKVTLTDVPANFPTETETRLFTPNSVFNDIKSYDDGADRKAFVAIESMLRGASPAMQQSIEGKLLKVLAMNDAKPGCKRYILRILRRIGSKQCVETVARLLLDPALSHMARFALQDLPAPEATTALAETLKKTKKGPLAIGMISSLGKRGDASAVSLIAPYLSDRDIDLATAAIKAMGRLGGDDALNALQEARVPRALKTLCLEAQLSVAMTFEKAGKTDRAKKIYSALSGSRTTPPATRVDAFRGLLAMQGADAVPRIIDLMGDRNPLLARGALHLLNSTKGTGITKAIADKLPDLKPALQVKLIQILSYRSDDAAGQAVLKALDAEDEAVKVAALQAIPRLGGADCVEKLMTLSLSDTDTGKAAMNSLSALKGKGVAKALGRFLKHDNAGFRAQAVALIVARKDLSAMPALTGAATDPVASVREAACKALGTLGGCREMGQLVTLLAKSDAADVKKQYARAIRAMAGRLDDTTAVSSILAQGLNNAQPDDGVLLLDIIPMVSTDISLKAVRKALTSGNARIKKAALRALGHWDNAAPIMDLKKLAADKASSLNALAMEGYLRLLTKPANRPSHETVALLKDALSFVKTTKDKITLVNSLSAFPCRSSLALAEALAKDPALKAAADNASQKIRSLLVKGKLAATASHNAGGVRNAFDDNPGSRWSTNTPMKPGMWFTLDLGVEQAVEKLVLDSRQSAGDYPRGSDVYVSFDGKNFGKPVLTLKAQGPVTEYNFKPALHGRYIKIVQTGEVPGLFWSIHELKVTLAK